MARRPGEDDGFKLSPRARRIGGWVAAGAIIAGIALAVGLIGGDGNGPAVDPVASGSRPAQDVPRIAFGTGLDPDSGEVTEPRERFTAGDTVAYAVRIEGTLHAAVFVEVRRTGGGPRETVQPPTEQPLPGGSSLVGVTVPADRLLAAFGPGEYRMIIRRQPDGSPVAQGAFALEPAPAESSDP